MSERVDLRKISSYVKQELLPGVRDIVLEPIRFSQALKERLGDSSKVPNYENLSRVTKGLFHVNRLLWSYLPIEMPLAMGAGLAIQGNPVAGALVGAGVWMFEGTMLKGMRIREQSQQ